MYKWKFVSFLLEKFFFGSVSDGGGACSLRLYRCCRCLHRHCRHRINSQWHYLTGKQAGPCSVYRQWRDNLIMDRNLKLLARCFDSHGLSSNILLSLSRITRTNFSRDKHFFIAFRWCKWRQQPSQKYDEWKFGGLICIAPVWPIVATQISMETFPETFILENLHSWIGWPIYIIRSRMNKMK